MATEQQRPGIPHEAVLEASEFSDGSDQEIHIFPVAGIGVVIELCKNGAVFFAQLFKPKQGPSQN